MSVTSILICLFCMIAFGKSIPPSQCFEPFNFEDCGQRPLHVLYFYKPGARCEVAIWRGCPTRNMFKDEYECINTCIFVERAKPEDYHNFGLEYDYQIPLTTEANDTIKDQERTTETGPDGEGTTESGGSDEGAGTGPGKSDGDATGKPAAAEGSDKGADKAAVGPSDDAAEKPDAAEANKDADSAKEALSGKDSPAGEDATEPDA